MAFSSTKMNHLGYETGYSRWFYNDGSGDTKTTINGSGYFNGYSSNLDVGDEIRILASDGPMIHVVTAVDRANSTVTTAQV